MILDLNRNCDETIIQDFLLNILEEAYYADEFKPDFLETMEYVEEKDEKRKLKYYIFTMLFANRIKNAILSYKRLYNEIKMEDLISAIAETLTKAMNSEYIDNYKIELDKNIIIKYCKDDYEESIIIKGGGRT